MIRVDIGYTINLDGPLHVGSGLKTIGYAERMVLRDHRGAPYLPGSTIKGAARDAVRRFAGTLPKAEFCSASIPCREDPCILCRLFGSPRRAGLLRFGNAVISAQADQHARFDPALFEVRNGVQICRQRRVALERHLYSTEFARPTDNVVFEGRITGVIDANKSADVEIPVPVWILLCGMKLIDRLGGGRSRGSGQVSMNYNRVIVDDGNDLVNEWKTSLDDPDLYLISAEEKNW